VKSVRGHGEEEGSEDDEIEGGDAGKNAQIDETETDDAEDEIDAPQDATARLPGRDRLIDTLCHPAKAIRVGF
jgi:hypothetical protein